jgi:hypothetical protein
MEWREWFGVVVVVDIVGAWTLVGLGGWVVVVSSASLMDDEIGLVWFDLM